jgi:LysR family transcriptional regulator for metE and metH
MEVRHLKLIREIAEKGSLTKATDSLYLSQSALSHQLREVESQLGTSLFHRVNKKLVITGAGKIVLESARKVLRELENTETMVKDYVGGDTGSVRVATQCYTCYYWLPSLMQDFNKEFPKVEINIFPEATKDPIKELLAGKLDLAVVSERIDNPNITYQKLFTDELLAVVHSDHPWAKRKYVNARDFANENVLVHSLPIESIYFFRDLLIPEDVQPKKVIPIELTEATFEMVKARMGVKVVAGWIAHPYLKDGRLTTVPVTRNGLYRAWYTATLTKPDEPQYIKNFIEHLKCNIAGVCKV